MQMLLDTSVLIELFQKDPQINAKLFDNYELVINNYIFAEFLLYVQKFYGKSKSIRARNLLLSGGAIEIIYLSEEYIHLANKIMNQTVKAQKDLNFIDCIILAHAKIDNLVLASKDLPMDRYRLVKHW